MIPVNMKMNKVKITASLVESSGDGFVVFCKDPELGGPVVCAKTKDEAVAKFSEALLLCFAISNLNAFNDAVRSEKGDTYPNLYDNNNRP